MSEQSNQGQQSESGSSESQLLEGVSDKQIDSLSSSVGVALAPNLDYLTKEPETNEELDLQANQIINQMEAEGVFDAENAEKLRKVFSMPASIVPFTEEESEAEAEKLRAILGFSDRLATTNSWLGLATLINDWAVWKGWYEKERSPRMFALLFESEVFEAFEELRKGAFETYFSDDRGYQKPEGYWVEIADVAIRALDYCGHTFADQAGWSTTPKTAFKINDWKDHEAVLWELKSACWVSVDALRDILAICKIYCEENGQNLRKLIDLKMRYNLVREHRHGGKLV